MQSLVLMVSIIPQQQGFVSISNGRIIPLSVQLKPMALDGL
jgi:hypothetical protein